MKLKQLQRTHADFDAGMLQKYRDLFEGGADFAKNISRYLIKNDQEPQAVYNRRCDIAKDLYVNYVGPIGNYFASWLFTSKLTYKSDPSDVDDFYASFKEDCDGDGTDFEQFLRRRFIDALIDQRSYWRIEFPESPPDESEPSVMAEWKAANLGRGVVRHVPTSSIINWKCDEDGFVWLVEYDCKHGLEEPDDEDETITETWTIWRRDEQHRRYQISYTKKTKPNPDAVIPEVGMPWTQGQIRGIPIVCMELPKELWMMNLVAQPQMESFRKRVGLSWAIDRNCYAMPAFFLKNRKAPPKMGTGYYLMLGPEDRVEYLSPPPTTFDVTAGYLESLKDEIHRVVQQMSRGVDNNAAAVGRSGMSKQSDDQQTEIVLSGFGQCVRESVERTMDKISMGRGEVVEFKIEGMESFHVTDSQTFITNAVAAQQLNIPSVTYHKEVAKRTALGQLPDIDEDLRQQINNEIESGVTEESIKPIEQEPPAETNTNEDSTNGKEPVHQSSV